MFHRAVSSLGRDGDIAPNPPVTGEKRKRPRAARACGHCRLKKYKCDEACPCTHCRRQNVDCVYEGAEYAHGGRAPSIIELEEKVELLSRQLALAQKALAEPSSGPLYYRTSTDFSPSQAGGTVRNEKFLQQRNKHLQTAQGGGLTSSRDERLEISDDELRMRDTNHEIRDINQHTRSVEFHGNTSSMAFLALVQDHDSLGAQNKGAAKQSLVTSLHNVDFSPPSILPCPDDDGACDAQRFFFRRSRAFIDGYFDTLHFVHPILERDVFLDRCEDLWFGRSEKQTRSFVGLYYAVLALGALIRTWDTPTLDELDRFQWSRKLFDHSRNALGDLRATNDMDTIHCLILLAKVCQNELNPHLAYMYLGVAVRACFSAGYHRQSTSSRLRGTPSDSDGAISKTWWALFQLEVEMSFSLGRPDSFGMESFYDRREPPLEDSETGFLGYMAPFGRITRKIAAATYLAQSSMRDYVNKANDIERELDFWLSTVPDKLKVIPDRNTHSGRIVNEPQWTIKQRQVLCGRYHNVRIVLFRPFLTYVSRTKSSQRDLLLQDQVLKCVEAATKTLQNLHRAFCDHVYFRTWWYNTTYILYAASIILCYATEIAPSTSKPDLFALIDMAIEMLVTMNECFVAKRAAEVMKQALANAREHAKPPHAEYGTSQVQQGELPLQEWALDGDVMTSFQNQLPLLPLDAMFNFDDPDFNFLWSDSFGPDRS